MLLPDEEDANIVMLATGTGIAPMRAYLRRMFEATEKEKNKWNFKGKAWLFMGAPKSANLLYCLLYTSPSPRDRTRSRMPSSA